MQNPTENSSSNIVSLFGGKKSAAPADVQVGETKEEPKIGFFDAMKKNNDNDERLRKERLKANQSVLKSYRIKN